jgi:hypothetical protein
MAKGSPKRMGNARNRLVDLSMSDAKTAEAVKGGVTKVEENMAQKDLLRKAQRDLESLKNA